jgi:hypothetical protein
VSILAHKSQLKLETRRGYQIENEIDHRPIRAGDAMMLERHRIQYPDGTHRPVGPSRKYNCHGLTFASRRTWIWKPSEIARILADDEYQQIDLHEVLPGDIVVYVQNGDAEHSGIVISVLPALKILSKWGPAHEVIHRVADCPYNAAQINYYRIKT